MPQILFLQPQGLATANYVAKKKRFAQWFGNSVIIGYCRGISKIIYPILNLVQSGCPNDAGNDINTYYLLPYLRSNFYIKESRYNVTIASIYIGGI